MPLTAQQRDHLLQTFQQVMSGAYSQCAICYAVDWQISDSIFGLPEFSDGILAESGGAFYPVVPVSCNTCGHVIFFNAIKLGLLDQHLGKATTEAR